MHGLRTLSCMPAHSFDKCVATPAGTFGRVADGARAVVATAGGNIYALTDAGEVLNIDGPNQKISNAARTGRGGRLESRNKLPMLQTGKRYGNSQGEVVAFYSPGEGTEPVPAWAEPLADLPDLYTAQRASREPVSVPPGLADGVSEISPARGRAVVSQSAALAVAGGNSHGGLA
jgi:hypothetical protein